MYSLRRHPPDCDRALDALQPPSVTTVRDTRSGRRCQFLLESLRIAVVATRAPS